MACLGSYRKGCRCADCREAHRVDAFTRRRAKFGEPVRLTADERFDAKVCITESCWLWTGSLDGSGYGMFKVGALTLRAHRFSYERAVGAIPGGLQLDHLCSVRNCVNPAHLEPVTAEENTRRGRERRTHCRRGHEYAPENIYWVRSCKACYQSRKEEVA